MLTQIQITEVEMVYIAGHTGMDDNLFAFIIQRFYKNQL